MEIFLIMVYNSYVMNVRSAKKALLLLLCLPLFGACGKLDTVLSPERTYQIRTQINGAFLDEYSLVSSGDTIRPYCSNSIAQDPDITELYLYFKNAQGEKAGGEIRYMLKLYADTYLKINENTTERSGTGIDTTGTDIIRGDVTEEGYEPDLEYSTGESSIIENHTTQNHTGISAANHDEIITVNRFERNLPSFSMPDNMEIGEYTLVIRIIGGKEILGELEQSFFYLGKNEFALKDIQLYLPGVYSGSRLIPHGTPVLLEARVEADERLSPYIIWYNGKKIIQEGRLSEGAGLVFWTAPEQAGFQTLRAEIFPSLLYQGMGGVSREIILPVSTKVTKSGFFSDKTAAEFAKYSTGSPIESENPLQGDSAPNQKPDLLHWYQFAGTLHDSNNPLASEKTLVPVTEGLPRWNPMDYSYGLATGPSDTYLLPPISFIPEAGQNGGSLFLLRAKALSNGRLFTAVYATASGGAAWVNIAFKNNNLVLSLSTKDASAKETFIKETSIPLNIFESGAYVSAALRVYLYNDHLEAQLIPEKSAANHIELLRIKAAELNGKCRISIGGSDDADFSLGLDQSQTKEPEKNRDKKEKIPETAIWNELAVLYMVPPDIPEYVEDEIVEDEIEDEIVEDEKKEASDTGTANTEDAKAKTINEHAAEAAASPTAAKTSSEPETINPKEKKLEPAETELESFIEYAPKSGTEEDSPEYTDDIF
jgi:hypothetical protein